MNGETVEPITASTGLARHRAPALVPARDPPRTLTIDRVPVSRMGAEEVARWKSLAADAVEPNVFLEPAFARAAASRFGGEGLVALCARSGDRLVGLLPGNVEGVAAGRPVRTFVAWTHPFAPLSTPLLHRDFAREAVTAILDSIPDLPGAPRVVLFPKLAEAGEVARHIERYAEERGNMPVRFDVHRRAALAPRGPSAAKHRKELGRQRRRLRDLGALEHRTVTDVDQVVPAIAEYLRLEASGWKGRTGSAALLQPDTRRFVTDAVSMLAREGKARVDLLVLDGRAIAATVVLRSGNRQWFWKTAYDERYAPYSPGVLLARDLTEALQEETEIALVDSCAVEGHPMIDRLWSGRLPIADWLVPLRGRSFSAVAAETGRRAAMRLAKALRQRFRPR